MKAKLLVRRRVILSEQSFADIVIWETPEPVKGSAHSYKYRLAYVVDSICVMRFDNEAGKGDHMHLSGVESAYGFSTIDRLLDDFLGAIERMES